MAHHLQYYINMKTVRIEVKQIEIKKLNKLFDLASSKGIKLTIVLK